MLEVQEIFPTIQGEGPFAGTPAIFVRLAGCNLQCPLCDTDYTSRAQSYQVDAVVTNIRLQCKGTGINLIVVTGGEPFRQSLAPLVKRLLVEEYEVQIETNGTLFDEGMVPYFNLVTTVCSPKAGVNPRLAEKVDAYKYVMRTGEVDPLDGLPTMVLGGSARPGRPTAGFSGDVFLQPADEGDVEKNAANLKACIESCMKFGYRLGTQWHKTWGLL